MLYDDDQRALGTVKAVQAVRDASVDPNRLADRLTSEIKRWRSTEGGGGALTPDIDHIEPAELEIVRPELVEWELFPYYFRCRRAECGVWQYKNDLADNAGLCMRCRRPSLEQTPFVWVHQCGWLRPLAPGKGAHCPRHGERALYLYDTGTFLTSSWRCRDCAHQARVGALTCPQCSDTSTRPQPMRWNDPGVFSTLTMQILNLPSAEREHLLGAAGRDDALRQLLKANLPAGDGAVGRFLEHSGPRCARCGAAVGAQTKFCAECGAELVYHDGPALAHVAGQLTDDLVTLASLWDLAGTRSLRAVDEWAPTSRQGVVDLIYMERFPISLVGYGYRRQRAKRPGTLCLFPSQNQTKRLRVYTNAAEVEALAVRLDPWVVLDWLERNRWGPIHLSQGATDAFDQLDVLGTLSEQDPVVNAAVLGVLHSVAHAFIRGLSWCSGMDLTSFSEELLPGALTAVVHAGDTALGGLSSVFEQAPWQPLESMMEDLIACQLDPACSEDDGGACVGCVFQPMGCALWNDHLSRAFLFGGETRVRGSVEGGLRVIHGFWS